MKRKDQKGQAVLEYVLVTAVLVLGLVASVYGRRPGVSLPQIWAGWYREMAIRVARP